ncbi:TRAP transporter small permease subunit [Chelatococcus reniformis]|uniref:TRAP transporter small permease protein n=1 Tax=Chelatococcus reniformis TaxID=1494448 RepID=A0A916XCA2_9HYPH|nr:TRAP transporter small permease subunit [Chelatococcus reniformis]GGC63398.1 hypothetical protein GCM10010994_22510 [Chelatococcus reniformis]
MPSLNFVLPHWLYWGALIAFPLLAMVFVARERRRAIASGPSLFVAYLFWLCSGFMGLHRLYVRSAWGFVFVPVLLAILYANAVIGDRREDVSRTRAAAEASHRDARRAEIPSGEAATPDMTARLAAANAAASAAEARFAVEVKNLERARGHSRWLAILMAVMLLIDAVLLPRVVSRAQACEAAERSPPHPLAMPADVAQQGTREDPTLGLHTWFTDKIELLNTRVGEFVAYWAVISVFVYYYEVMARYVFNSPTNWVHESMFLMFGMQYMLAGAYAYREDQHVRVDVFYARFSPRGKAMADIVTSVFFFIFAGVMFWTSWRFALDSIGNNEHSFTEWGIQYWPIKLTMPLGAALLFLQGVAKLAKDIALLARGSA